MNGDIYIRQDCKNYLIEDLDEISRKSQLRGLEDYQLLEIIDLLCTKINELKEKNKYRKKDYIILRPLH